MLYPRMHIHMKRKYEGYAALCLPDITPDKYILIGGNEWWADSTKLLYLKCEVLISYNIIFVQNARTCMASLYR